MTTHDLLALLTGVRRAGPDSWTARCPAHDDRAPSLSVRAKPEGRLLIHCHAGCPTADVVAALGLRMADLFADAPARPGSPRPAPPPPRPVVEKPRLVLPSCWTPGTDPQRDALARLRGLPREAVDHAADVLGILRFTAAEWALACPSGFTAQRRRLDGGKFAAERKALSFRGSRGNWPLGVHAGLAQPDVLLVEGGGDYLAAAAVILSAGAGREWAVAAMLGASAAPHPEAVALLRGRHVRLVPHLDPAGAEAARRWGAALAGTARRVSVASPWGEDNPPPKGAKDLNDWLRLTPWPAWKDLLQ